MVYRGRPSTGCLKCRQRKIKCDERPDGCIKCADKRYICPGYDTTLDRYFQDESSRVEEKAKKAKAKAIAKRDERHRSEKTRTAVDRLQESIEFPILFPLIDQGISYFMMKYAVGLDQPPIQSDAYNRHLSTFGFHPLIATSMTALGLAGISNICLDVNFKMEATNWYLKALKMTNAALASPMEVKSDTTLFATLLLSVFEATNNETSLAGWSNHVSGSESLIRMRGTKQVNNPAGRRMFKQAIGSIAMNCMGLGKSLPDYVYTLNKQIQKYENFDDPGTRYYYLHIETIDFRAQIIHNEITDLAAIIDRALELDEAAKGIFKNAEPEWNFEVVQTNYGTPGVFGNSYHIYPSPAVSQVWNWVRYNRIYIYDIIRNCLISGFSATPPVFTGPQYVHLLQKAQEILYQMQYDILASIPQHLQDTPKIRMPYTCQSVSQSPSSSSSNSPEPSSSPGSSKLFWSNFRDPDFCSQSMTSGVSEDRIPVVRTSGGYSTTWALYIAGAMSVATAETQDFVLRSLNRIGHEFGINQAKVLAKVLMLKIHSEVMGNQEFEIAPAYLPMQGGHVE